MTENEPDIIVEDTEIIPDPGGWVAYALLIACVIFFALYAVALIFSI